jgi:zinc protease
MNDHSFQARTKRYQLNNGITLLVLENHSNPTVSLSGSARAGEYFNPPGKDNLAGVTANMLNKGAGGRTKLEIAEGLESAGARAGVGANTFTISVSGLSLSRDLPLVISTLADQLRAPSFPKDELEKLKQRIIANIQEDQEDTRSRAYERLSQSIFAETSPFYIFPTERVIREIEGITVEDIQGFYQQYYGAGSMVLGVVGDVKPDEVLALVEEKLGDWEGAAKPEIDLPMTPLQTEARREVVAMKDKPNCDVLIGHASQLRRSNPDYFEAVIANNALGESTLSSRLGIKVRDEMGLTYGINSSFSKTGIGDGPFLIGVTVAPENIDRAIDAALEIVDDYISTGIREEELRDEKTSMVGSYKLGLATNAGIAGQLVSAEVFGLGVQFLDEYPSLIKDISKEQIDQAIRKYFHPRLATTVIAGTF